VSDRIEFLLVVAGFAAAFWGQTKRLIAWLRGWVVVTRNCDMATGLTLIAYLAATRRIARSSNKAYGSLRLFVRPLERVHRIVYESLYGADQTFWRGLAPIWYAPLTQDGTGKQAAFKNTPVISDYTMSFSCIRGTVAWDDLLLAMADWEAVIDDEAPTGTRFCVRHHLGSIGQQVRNGDNPTSSPPSPATIAPDSPNRILRWTHDDIRTAHPVATLDTMSLRPELVAVVERMKFWLSSRSWYTERGIPWRFGALFFGRAGTGKTSLARGIAEDLDLPVHAFDLASMTNRDLRDAWSEMVSHAPCMALLEDIDAVFDGRANVTGDAAGRLSFDCLLNCWDGIDRTDGVVVVVTTNHVSKVDSAIVDRPGRIDTVVEFEPLDRAGRVKIATRILGDSAEAERLATEYEDDPVARFQERCVELAIARRFSGLA
jgi:ATPase family associated with various cellular activities (AAA)